MMSLPFMTLDYFLFQIYTTLVFYNHILGKIQIDNIIKMWKQRNQNAAQ